MNTKTRKTNNGSTKGEPKSFSPQEVERSLFKALVPALEARAGSVHSFADWTLSGHGIVLRLPNGQEFWLPISEADYCSYSGQGI
jgi:hypothetical protein